MDPTQILAIVSLIEKASKVVDRVLKNTKEPDTRQALIELQGVYVSLQSQLVSMQVEHSKLLQIKNDLEKKLVEYENWDKTEPQYKLEEVAPSVFVFSLKEDNRVSEPNHWLCTNCFYDRKKSILQRHGISRYLCPKCKNEIIVPSEKSWG